MGGGIPMAKINQMSIKQSMTITFIITLCLICLLSGITIFYSNQAQQELMRNRYGIIKNPDFTVDEETGGYFIDIDKSDLEWHELSIGQNIAYYSCYFGMIGLPILYIIAGIGIAAKIYYRKKLRVPITQLQNGIDRIQNNDLDFNIQYNGNDELGQLCYSMEKMRKELRQNNKKLWRTIEERKLLNASVAHDLRTPITVLKGYLDYLQINIPQENITEDSLMDTLFCMKEAVVRLERYVDCVRDIERLENIEMKREPQDTQMLVNELKQDISQLEQDKKLIFTSDISSSTINIDKSVFFRILDNLIRNAIRYAESKIEIGITQNEDFLILSVKDDGMGFSDTDLMQATTLFYSKDKGKEHFGIGLSICKLLCEKHGGTLYLSNGKEKGACIIAEIKIL